MIDDDDDFFDGFLLGWLLFDNTPWPRWAVWTLIIVLITLIVIFL